MGELAQAAGLSDGASNLFNFWWIIGGAFFLGVIWLVRLESKVLYLEKEKDLRDEAEANKVDPTIDLEKRLVILETENNTRKTSDQERDRVMWKKLEDLQTSMNKLDVTISGVKVLLEHIEKQK